MGDQMQRPSQVGTTKITRRQLIQTSSQVLLFLCTARIGLSSPAARASSLPVGIAGVAVANQCVAG